MPLMGYRAWIDFKPTIERGKASAEAQGSQVDTLFRIATEKTAGRPRENFRLTRFAAYLVAMNGDPRKPEVAARIYFPGQH